MVTPSTHEHDLETSGQGPYSGATQAWAERIKGARAGLDSAALRDAYQIALETRASIISCMTMKGRGEEVEFWIGGPGEEVHGVATAKALHDSTGGDTPSPRELAYFLHYRSDALAAMATRLRQGPDFVRSYFRQALSRITDPHSGGRQMVMHLCMPQVGIQPVQSPVGMQLGKAAGYARGLQIKGTPGLVAAIVGDGTTAEGDMHDAMHAASVWGLPLIIVVTDNEVAITVRPEDGRGIRSYERYAEAFGFHYFQCDGHDFMDTYRRTYEAAETVLSSGRPAILHAHVPRLMGHSSSSGGQFDYMERDPLLEMGSWLVDEGVLTEPDVFHRLDLDKRKSYFEVHSLGTMMTEALERVRGVVQEVRQEPSPSVEAGDLWRFSHPPYPEVEEPETTPGSSTRVQLNEALNLALDRMLSGGKAAIWGQDVGHRGGVFQVTVGLREKYGELVRDCPLNEPMIVGTACGAALHDDLALIPEIQFCDYSLNCLHWFVHLGNMHWSTNGQVSTNVTVRMPVDPVQGGAIYHSMSVDGFYGNIPGLVLIHPSSSYDAYGLLRTAMDYKGPVLQFESKMLYRMRLGPALPGEPESADILRDLRRSGTPLPIEDYRIPFGKAALRRAGRDLTVVSWGRAGWQAKAMADAMASSHGIETEVWDLRCLVPYDRDAILESARRTGRVLVVQNDRTFAGFGRQIQGDLLESLPGVVVRLIGQRNTPAIGQSRALEDATVLQDADLSQAMEEIVGLKPAAWLNNELHWLRHAPGRRFR